MRNIKMREGTDEVVGYPENMYIVYFHRDPETRDVVYIGEGRIDRAYQITSRGYDHHCWLLDKLIEFDVQDIVEIRGGNYTKDEARAIEMHEIKRALREGCNLFNVDKNPYRRTRRKASAGDPQLSESSNDGQSRETETSSQSD